jgi:hypothetical protein
MSIEITTAITCAACGNMIIQGEGIGPGNEFCSIICYRAGRSFCKGCGKSLPPPIKGHKRTYCSDRKCQRKPSANPLLIEEWNRSVCKNCRKPITQPKAGIRFYCSDKCGQIYRYLKMSGRDILEKWGAYGPETRKALRHIENMLGMSAALQVATAIEQEYILRKPKHRKKSQQSYYIECQCKTCGKDFRRKPWGHQSKDYCDNCQPSKGQSIGEKNTTAKLTREQVNEIRHIYMTEQLSLVKLAERYGVTKSAIYSIVHYRTWKSEDNSRIKQNMLS